MRWLASVSEVGIGTIVCLATDGELRRYSAAVGGEEDLLALYRSAGFLVHHHPVEDPAYASGEAALGIREQLERLKPEVYEDYRSRKGALLTHCSGGRNRASPIGAAIAASERPNGP